MGRTNLSLSFSITEASIGPTVVGANRAATWFGYTRMHGASPVAVSLRLGHMSAAAEKLRPNPFAAETTISNCGMMERRWAVSCPCDEFRSAA